MVLSECYTALLETVLKLWDRGSAIPASTLSSVLWLYLCPRIAEDLLEWSGSEEQGVMSAFRYHLTEAVEDVLRESRTA